MPTFTNFTFPCADGKTTIHTIRCNPDGAPRGVFQIAHGIAEHAARYNDFAAFMASHGFVVVANDHLGHGRSVLDEDSLGFFADENGWQLAVSDMKTLHDIMADEFPNLPHFLFGHSMGSFLARTYLISHRAGLSGAILSGTGQQSPALIAAGRAMGELELKKHGAKYKSERINSLAFGSNNKAYASPRTASDWISRDEAVVDKYLEDPLCGYVPSVKMFLDLLGGLSIIGNGKKLKYMNKLLPIFFLSGDRDPVGENGAAVFRVYKSFLNAGMQDVTLKLYHEGRHEMLNELNKKAVYKDILSWVEGTLSV